MTSDFSKLKRPVIPMPPFIAYALKENGLLSAYANRPAYQQNDYIAWIMRAKRAETRNRRLQQMLDELKAGGLYMNMRHPPSLKQG
jgi:uncharacterized protein YdeI (YjbR/CyaY-like superfamily)